MLVEVAPTLVEVVLMSSVKYDVSEHLKKLIISFWIRLFLQRIGSKHPEFLSALLDDVNVTRRQKIIMSARYIDKLKFKQIPYVKGVNCELRNVLREHQKVIDKLINL